MLPADTLLSQRYRVVRPIGQGGMGAVYETIDTRLGMTRSRSSRCWPTHMAAAAFRARGPKPSQGCAHPALPAV